MGRNWFESRPPDKKTLVNPAKVFAFFPVSALATAIILAMAYFVYILQSSMDKKFYIGCTSNVEARLEFHNKGLQRSTKHRIPFILAYHEVHIDKASALKREKQLKRFKGGKAFKKLLEGGGPA